MSGDSAFTGSIPETYESGLVPVLFAPYARDLAARIEQLEADTILEIAAGTGAATREIAARLRPGQHLIATDLNQAMLNVAARQIDHPAVEFAAADAQALPFGDGAFDGVAVQFGVMFYPDRAAAHREARRVLRPGGTYLFNLWNRLEDNPASQAVHQAAMALAQGAAPDFIARVPFGYNDEGQIKADLADAGFAEARIERLDFEQPADLLPGLVAGLCRGSPLAAALAEQPNAVRTAIETEATERLAGLAQNGPVTMSALVVTCRLD